MLRLNTSKLHSPDRHRSGCAPRSGKTTSLFEPPHRWLPRAMQIPGFGYVWWIWVQSEASVTPSQSFYASSCRWRMLRPLMLDNPWSVVRCTSSRTEDVQILFCHKFGVFKRCNFARHKFTTHSKTQKVGVQIIGVPKVYRQQSVLGQRFKHFRAT